MLNHPYVLALLGGMLLGLSATVLLLFSGRILGISGILGSLLQKNQEGNSWRWFFVLGLLAGGFVFLLAYPPAFASKIQVSPWIVALSGLLVGYGTRLGGGCTSGHGICGNSRLSARSIVATVTFMATGAVAVYVVQHLLGGK